jgi:hypothetical protein
VACACQAHWVPANSVVIHAVAVACVSTGRDTAVIKSLLECVFVTSGTISERVAKANHLCILTKRRLLVASKGASSLEIDKSRKEKTTRPRQCRWPTTHGVQSATVIIDGLELDVGVVLEIPYRKFDVGPPSRW